MQGAGCPNYNGTMLGRVTRQHGPGGRDGWESLRHAGACFNFEHPLVLDRGREAMGLQT